MNKCTCDCQSTRYYAVIIIRKKSLIPKLSWKCLKKEKKIDSSIKINKINSLINCKEEIKQKKQKKPDISVSKKLKS